MSPEQQQWFRADAKLPVLVRSALGETLSTATNLSKSGVGLQSFDSRLCGPDGAVEVSITLSSGALVRANGNVVWTTADGRAGIRFSNVDPACEPHLNDWIAGKITEEGWALPDQA